MQVVRYCSNTVEWRKGEEYIGTYLRAWDSGGKLPVIPDNVSEPKV